MLLLHSICLLAASQTNQAPTPPPPLDVLRGHFEIQVNYDETDGWWAGYTYTLGSNFDNPQPGEIGIINADEVEFVMPGVSRRVSNFALTPLVPLGTPVWVIPQGSVAGHHFLGVRSILPFGAFQNGDGVALGFFPGGRGNINLRLADVTGSGPERGGLVGARQDGSGFESASQQADLFAFNTSDGINEEDIITAITPGSHTHYNWIFTQPGVYKVHLEAFGRLRDGTDTVHPFTLTFQVPHDGIISAIDAGLAYNGEDWELLCRDMNTSVTYGEEHCYLYATQASTNPNVLGWQAPFTFAIDNPETNDLIGVSADLAASAPDFAGGVSLKLVKHVGPGEVIAFDENANSLLDSRDGLDANDSLLLSNTAIDGQLHFTEAGVHHLSFLATGLDASGNAVTESRPLTMRCGANLAPDHSYQEWADSYERAYDLAAGTLADPNQDFDKDGLHHNLEYLLDVMGATPVGADQVGRFDLDVSPPRFVFMRDLHKDSFTDDHPALFPSQSFDLRTWERITRRNDGLPISLHEVPIITGNARSMFMERSLSNPLGDPNTSFFQLSTD